MSQGTKPLVLKFGRIDGRYVVRIDGRGTMQSSPALQAFAREALRGEPEASLTVDLSDCEYLDSTFLGCLVALHHEFGQEEPPRFEVAAPPAIRAQLLERTRLDRVLHVVEAAPAAPPEWLTIPNRTLERQDFARHLIDCHRQLAELGGPDATAFRRVVDQLARELEERPSSPDSSY